MATTSPDSLRSPNPTDPYNLVADWAISMNDVQAALNKRGNLYIGTSAQRTAFAAPEGTHWQDTNGTRLTYVRKSSVWEPLVPNLGVNYIRSGSYTASSPNYVTVSFATPFPAGTIPHVVAQVVSGSGAAIGVSPMVTSVTNAGFNSRTSSGGPFTLNYIAVAQ